MKLRIVAGLLLGAIILGGAALGRALIEDASGGGWWHEGGEAWEAERNLIDRFGTGRPNLIFLVAAADGDIDSAASTDAGQEFVATLEESGLVAEVESYWGLGMPDWYRSADGTTALVMARIPGPTAAWAARADVVDRLTRDADPAVSVTMGGEATVARDVKGSLGDMLPLLGAVALVALVAAGAFLRSWRATILIGAAAVLAVALTLAGLYGVATYREVPLLAVLLGVAVAWGLTSANGLLMTARFAGERRLGNSRRDAMLATIPTAGRTVALASGVVAVVGAALWFLPTALLRSTGYAFAIGGVAAGLASVVVLGFALAIVGTGPAANGAPPERTRVDRVSAWTRRHTVAALAVTAVLVVPPIVAGLGVATRPSGPESLAADTPARHVAETVDAAFASDDAAAPFVIARTVSDAAGADRLTRDYLKQISGIPGVTRVDSAMGVYVAGEQVAAPRAATARHRGGDDGMWFLVATEGSADGSTAAAVTADVAAAEAPFRTQMGGLALRQEGTVSAVEGRTLAALGLAAVGIMLLAAWMLRSGSLGARLGIAAAAMTAGGYAVLDLGMARGGLGRVVGFDPTGWIGVSVPPLGLGLGLALAAALLVYGGGAAREETDVTGNARADGARALASSLKIHSEMAFLLALPLLPVAFSSWSTAQGIGAAAIATVLVAATVGRFLVLPLVLSVAPQRLWTREGEDELRTVYPQTPVTHHLFVAHPAVATAPEPVAAPEPVIVPVAVAMVSADTLVAAPMAPKSVEPEPVQPVIAEEAAVPEPVSEAAAPATAAEATPESPMATETATIEAAPAPAAEIVPEPVHEAAVDPEPVLPEPAVAAAVAPEAVAEVVPDPVPAAEELAPVAVHVAQPEEPEPDVAEVVAEPAVEPAAAPPVPRPRRRSTPAPKPAASVDASEAAAEPEPAAAEVVAEPVVEPAAAPPAPRPRRRSTPAPKPAASVDASEAAAEPEPAAAEVVAEPAVEPAAAPPAPRPRRRATPAAKTPAPAADATPAPATSQPAVTPPAARVEPQPAIPAPPTPVEPERAVATPAARAEPGPGPQPEPEPQRSLTVAPRPEPAARPRRPRPPRETDPVIAEPVAGMVDVIKLTESVIASLESDTDFTTEVGTGLVANPSNNLSRVMEAILRDASRRGGQEVLVYGQASQDRYRWMVVDTGPRADNDPDRARTLAEAQRFIRRVGGVVECRPEGDFTVFVVEIPMAS